MHPMGTINVIRAETAWFHGHVPGRGERGNQLSANSVNQIDQNEKI